MSFFSSLAKSVGGIVGGAIGTAILPGAGTALGAALGGALGGHAYDAAAGGGGGGAAPAAAPPSLAPRPTYNALFGGSREVISPSVAAALARARQARTHGTAAGTAEEQRVLALMRARRAAKLAESGPSKPMSTGAKVGLAVGGGTVVVGAGTALYFALRR